MKIVLCIIMLGIQGEHEEVITKVWKDPVWSIIIATGILVVAGTISGYFLNWWPSIKKGVSFVFTFLGSTTAIWNWLLGLMFLFVLVVVFALTVRLCNLGVDWKNYTSDNFFGLEWHWCYGSDGMICKLYSCCCRCHYQVFSKDVSSYSTVPKIAFHCDSCGERVGPLEGTTSELESKIERFIQQKLRTGNWPSDKNA